MNETRNKVSRIIRDLHDEMGGAILIEDVLGRADEEGISEAEVKKAIADLEMDGLVSRIDDETIEFM